MDPPQDDRPAENQALFRDVNERVSRMRGEAGDVAAAGLLDFLCECARQDCLEKVRMTHEEYEAVRGAPTDFVVTPGHQAAGVERIVSQNDRFTVVRKEGRAAEIARKRDPRSRP